MKTKILYTVLLAICTIPLANAQWGKAIKGSGTIITKVVNTSNYDGVSVKGSMTIVLEKGTEGTLKVEADDNIIDLVMITTENNVLQIAIKSKSSYNSRNEIKVYVPFTDLNEITLHGSGNIISKNPINSNTLTCTLRGSGDIKAEIEVTTLNASLKGSGDIELSGNTNQLSLEMSGSGNFKGFDLNSQKTDVSLTGSGDIEVNATQSIKASLTGSGDITYSGNPKTKDVNVKGSGEIDSRN